MAALIKEVFDRVVSPTLVVDYSLLKKTHAYQTGFVNKNTDHIEFFGGTLTGVNVVRFMDSDKNKWFDDIIDADEDFLKENLDKVPDIQNENGVFKVSGDPMNLSTIWLAHQVLNQNHFSVEQKREFMTDIFLILQFKFLTSRLYVHFKWPADPGTAQATYNALSNKFLLKQQGSWLKVLQYRCADIIDPHGSFYDVLLKMDDDKRVVRLVNDIQGRIRDMIKNIYSVFIEIHSSGNKVLTTSTSVEFDGAEILRDKIKGPQVYKNYLKTVVVDKKSFIREELVGVVCKLMPSASPKYVISALSYMSDYYLVEKTVSVDELIDAVMLHSYAYIDENRALIKSKINLENLLVRLKGVYTSSRSTDPELFSLRENTEKLIRKSVFTKTDSVVASVRTAVLLYLVARAYTMYHYSMH